MQLPANWFLSRRDVLAGGLWAMALSAAGGCASDGQSPTRRADAAAAPPALDPVAAGVRDFMLRCARPDGGYAPSPDPAYAGNSDTGLSDLAAVTYAAVLCKTMGWELADPAKSIAFIHRHQQPDGRFVNLGGKMKPEDPLAVLYNTTQGVVALRALGQRPQRDPTPVLAPFFAGDAYRKLPWYTTSFFPLFYAALDQPFPAAHAKALADHMITNQKEDGYLQDHVAATFHMAHYFRLLGQPTPKAREMLQRTLRDQKPDGGWDLKHPDWDVHACFDALFIVRQLGDGGPACRDSLARAGAWALRCRNADGGFAHYPGRHSDMDAVYFNFASLLQAGLIAPPPAQADLPDAHTLSWGHAMRPGRIY